MELTKDNLRNLFDEQLNNWPQARNNYTSLEGARYRTLEVNGMPTKVQCNPARIVSSAAKLDAQSIKERRCFLCGENRPEVQHGLDFEAPSGNSYTVLVNPFPIFPRHLTIPDIHHTRQTIRGRYEDMLGIVSILDDYVVFYNGPKCGASAPDHLHFQAGNRGFLPIEKHLKSIPKSEFYSSAHSKVYFLKDYIRGAFVIQSTSEIESSQYFYDLLNVAECPKDDIEPMVNILIWKDGDVFTTVVVLREVHRPLCFFMDGDDNLLISPAAVDFGGVFITPLKKDFEKVGHLSLEAIIDEVTLTPAAIESLRNKLRKSFRRYQPKVKVGVMSDVEISVDFIAAFKNGNESVSGYEHFKCAGGNKIEWRGKHYDSLSFESDGSAESVFELKNVTIGVNFHWERRENQKFQGDLLIIAQNGKLTAINLVGVEDYMTSVISSEMSATASKEFLKAHAVISRSWLLAQIEKRGEFCNSVEGDSPFIEEENLRIKWYDRDDHDNFDVCADDHCQRYQGITRVSAEIVRDVVNETWGEVLEYDGKICDARFSKCCGGVFEEFPTCWENIDYPYLRKGRDIKGPIEDVILDLTDERKAERWIMSSPGAFCNTSDRDLLGQVLNNYDKETTDFFRWRVEYSQKELAALIKERSGIDFGEILNLIPIKRGTSGRICELKIVGMERQMTIGKELEIRRTLSPSHLFSSAFVVKTEGITDDSEEVEIPAKFILYGAGWGHGVGLCQIGAAVMGSRGYEYKEILLHYYKDASVARKY